MKFFSCTESYSPPWKAAHVQDLVFLGKMSVIHTALPACMAMYLGECSAGEGWLCSSAYKQLHTVNIGKVANGLFRNNTTETWRNGRKVCVKRKLHVYGLFNSAIFSWVSVIALTPPLQWGVGQEAGLHRFQTRSSGCIQLFLQGAEVQVVQE